MKSTNEKLNQLDKLILTILRSGNNSTHSAIRWAKLLKYRSELKNK
jgi:hypothetical protein